MATGARMPSSVQMRRALRVVFFNVWFPATELTPRMSKPVAASIQAMGVVMAGVSVQQDGNAMVHADFPFCASAERARCFLRCCARTTT